ncbi:MAG: metal-sensing transcriptional repressor [Lachnospiraceae bacterium]|nr:metal-sensing transcriptional repressor [Lachnospiraceae bacterium]
MHTHDDTDSLHNHTHDHTASPLTHTHGGSTHTHGGSAHTHVHTHTHTQAVLNRLSRAIGHLTSVRKMVENGRDCSEVLIQLAAVRSAINSTSEVILKDHLENCIVDAVKTGDMAAIAELNKAIEMMLK